MVKLTWREKRRLRDQGLMPPAANARVVFTEQMDATLRLSVECGKSFSDYAAQLGISADTVGKRAKKLGILSSQSRGKNKPVDWSVVGPIVDRERGRGESERRIGRTVSLSGGTVRKYLIANGLSGRVGQLRKAGLIPPRVQEINQRCCSRSLCGQHEADQGQVSGSDEARDRSGYLTAFDGSS